MDTVEIQNDAGEWMPVVVHLNLPITSYRPEDMRVVTHDGWALVQSKRPHGSWLTMKAHKVVADAIQDALDWYPVR